MGNYLNPGDENFRRIANSEIYVDKTGLLAYTNKTVFIPNNEVRAIWQGCGDWEAGR